MEINTLTIIQLRRGPYSLMYMLWCTTTHSSHLWEETMAVIYFCPRVNSLHNHLNRPWKIPYLCGASTRCRVLSGEIHRILYHSHLFWHTLHDTLHPLKLSHWWICALKKVKKRGKSRRKTKVTARSELTILLFYSQFTYKYLCAFDIKPPKTEIIPLPVSIRMLTQCDVFICPKKHKYVSTEDVEGGPSIYFLL